MFYTEPIFLILSGAAVILIAANIYFAICFFKFKKKIALLLVGKKTKNLEDVILNQLQKVKKQEADIIDLFSKVKNLENISEKTFQKIGIVRFNPFNDMGGNQSFVIALLDNRNNGFVISSLFTKEGNRIYAKSIKGGQSDYSLSGEEKDALERAMSAK
ncbi:DUF4446 family protein [Patescibacteria group bacterium]|nr:DUF4446 family protein [Patescibacteria group bacterium]